MLWDAAAGQVDPVAFPSGNYAQAYIPPEQTEVCYPDLQYLRLAHLTVYQ